MVSVSRTSQGCACAVLAFVSGPLLGCQYSREPVEWRGPINLDGVVIVQRRGQEDFCSGALVSDRLVLTALHCVRNVGDTGEHGASSFQVGFGTSTYDEETRWVDVREVLVSDESYAQSVEDLRGSDFALLVLETPVDRTPFPMPVQMPLPEKDAELVIVGFGEDRYGYVGKKHTTRVTVMEQTENGFAFVGGACRGDSGGPILDRNGRLVGLISLGTTKHCIPERTRFGQPLAAFTDFITDQLLRGDVNN